MTIIENKTMDAERALYGSDGVLVRGCAFDGPADGESALKESRDVEIENCFFNLRYPFWHDHNLKIRGSELTDKCRAALWYSEGVEIKDTKMHGIKALRECADVKIRDCDIISAEFGWSVRGCEMRDTTAESEYFMMRSTDLHFKNVKLKGKYSFQYIENSVFENCEFDTKDAFWHAKNVIVRDSVVKGRVPRLVLRERDLRALPHHRHAAAVLLQGAEAHRLRDGKHRPRLREVRGGGHGDHGHRQHQEPLRGPISRLRRRARS